MLREDVAALTEHRHPDDEHDRWTTRAGRGRSCSFHEPARVPIKPVRASRCGSSCRSRHLLLTLRFLTLLIDPCGLWHELQLILPSRTGMCATARAVLATCSDGRWRTPGLGLLDQRVRPTWDCGRCGRSCRTGSGGRARCLPIQRDCRGCGTRGRSGSSRPGNFENFRCALHRRRRGPGSGLQLAAVGRLRGARVLRLAVGRTLDRFPLVGVAGPAGVGASVAGWGRRRLRLCSGGLRTRRDR